jgi:hypothetical protein
MLSELDSIYPRIQEVLKKIIIAAVLILITKGLVHLFIDNKQVRPIAQSEVDKVVVETVKKPREELDRMLVENEKKLSTTKISQTELESLLIALNKTYPKTSPNGIRIDRATAGSGLITFHKTMENQTIADFDINPSNSESFRDAFVKEACSNSGVKNFLRTGVSVQTIQRDKNGALIYDFTANPKDCA